MIRTGINCRIRVGQRGLIRHAAMLIQKNHSSS